MNTVLIYTAYPEEYQKKIEDAFALSGYKVVSIKPNKDTSTIEKAISTLQEASVAILGAGLPVLELEKAPNLKWVHYDWVGIEGGLSKTLFEKGIIVTNGSGRNSICLSEHVFYFIFTLSYDSRAIFSASDKHQWGVERTQPYTSLFQKNMLIVGTGSIGQEIAKRAKAFGMNVFGFSRTKKYLDMFDELYCIEEGTSLSDIVSKADFLVLATGLNADSYHLVNMNLMKKMKPTAFIINICRGSVIDEKDLIEALKTDIIAGAGCDTFEKEPLSAESELYDLKNMVITPHSTPQSPLKFEIGTNTIIENIGKLAKGERLINQQSIKDILK